MFLVEFTSRHNILDKSYIIWYSYQRRSNPMTIDDIPADCELTNVKVDILTRTITLYGDIVSDDSANNKLSLGDLPPPEVPDLASIIKPSKSINPCLKKGIRANNEAVGKHPGQETSFALPISSKFNSGNP